MQHAKSILSLLTFIAAVLMASAPLHAQTASETWQQLYEELMDNAVDDDDGTASATDAYDLLQQLAAHPIDLNTATTEELEQLPFLSSQQVADILGYRLRYGGFSSVGELRMVRSLDFLQLTLLPFFVSISAEGVKDDRNARKVRDFLSILSHGRHTLTATGRMPFYNRRGDRNGYLGYKYRHWLRYEFDCGQYVRAGLTASQDAGEPFFSGNNKQGYDLYNYFVQVQKMGPLENAVAGKYKLSMGMGLLSGASFSLGKQATLQSLGRTTRSLRPHASRSEADYFHGLAATVRLARPLALTAFVSHRPVDATLNADGTASSLIYSGYHRSPTEMQKKHNTHLTSTGASLAWHRGALRLGLNAIYTHIDRPLEPNRDVLYRRHYAHGSDFANLSVDYAYNHYRFTLSGETATDRYGHMATLNTLSLRVADNLSLVAVQRFYSYRYTSLHGHCFGDSQRPQNESGVYIGASWRPATHWQLQAYADYASFPWARYQASQPSHATDLLLQATYERSRLSLQARYRVRLRQKDNADKTALTAADDHRARLQLTITPNTVWRLKTQADYAVATYKTTSRGWLLAQQVDWQHRALLLRLIAAGFNTDDYQSRLYLYEPHMEGDFSFPTYYGQGLRLALTARADVGRHLRLSLRLGHTRYFDRDAIGSGLQLISQPQTTEADLQLRWRF